MEINIFDQSEIALTGDLDKIRYYFNGNSAFTDNPVNVYVGHTTKSTFSNTTDWIANKALQASNVQASTLEVTLPTGNTWQTARAVTASQASLSNTVTK